VVLAGRDLRHVVRPGLARRLQLPGLVPVLAAHLAALHPLPALLVVRRENLPQLPAAQAAAADRRQREAARAQPDLLAGLQPEDSDGRRPRRGRLRVPEPELPPAVVANGVRRAA
jgi:hypothetical protein